MGSRRQPVPSEGSSLELASVVFRGWARRELRRRKKPVFLSRFVFHRGDGKQLKDFRKTWSNACAAAGVPGRLFHDPCRSAARNLVRAGVDRDVARKITGHRTESMFSRYSITDERDQREALRRSPFTSRPERESVREKLDFFSRTRTVRGSEMLDAPSKCLSNQAPRAGLEPATNRLTADRSTN